MTDVNAMVERAAAAIKRFDEGLIASVNYEAAGRAALLAALDPEGEALVELVMRAITQGAERNGGPPYGAITGNKHFMAMLRDEATEVLSALRRSVRES
jgi:hypothetical protein